MLKSSTMHPEKLNLWRTTNFRQKIKLSLFFGYKLVRRQVRPHIKIYFFYPKVIRKSFKRFRVYSKNCFSQSKPSFFTDIALSNKGEFSNKLLNDINIKLATGYLKVEDTLDWRLIFDDPEQTVSLHRWGWLLHLFLKDAHSHVLGMDLINDWCIKRAENRNELATQSYTISERICCAFLYSDLTKIPLSSWVQEQLTDSVQALSQQLEYHWFDEFGNHVVNNARALYYAGYYLKIPYCIELASAILQHALQQLITEDGFLREGSSHYHFLITRWLLEISLLASCVNDNTMMVLFRKILPKMVARCWFFIVQHQGVNYMMPLIGDVSPDCSWEFLIDLPWSQVAQQYCKVDSRFIPPPQLNGFGYILDEWLMNLKHVSLDACDKNTNSQEYVFDRLSEAATTETTFCCQSFSDSGWYRLDWHNFTIFWHVEPTGSPSFASHGHCDTGSFVLYWKGQEVLIDPGRLNYQWDNPLGAYGVSASAHNSVCIDGFDPFVYGDRSHYPLFYRQQMVLVDMKKQNDQFELIIEHKGFTRLPKDAIHYRRRFLVAPQSVNIVDEFSGQQTHLVESFFQWAPAIRMQKEQQGLYRFDSPVDGLEGTFECSSVTEAKEWTIVQGNQSQPIAGWQFPRYGVQQPISTLIHRYKMNLSSTVTYQLKMDVI